MQSHNPLIILEQCAAVWSEVTSKGRKTPIEKVNIEGGALPGIDRHESYISWSKPISLYTFELSFSIQN